MSTPDASPHGDAPATDGSAVDPIRHFASFADVRLACHRWLERRNTSYCPELDQFDPESIPVLH